MPQIMRGIGRNASVLTGVAHRVANRLPAPSERRSRVRGVGAASRLGHSAQEHLRTHAHFVIDRSELDYADVLTNARPVQTP
jgi:hypothetical protein